MTAREEILAELDVVEYLAVERNPQRPVFVRHRLRAAGEVDHAPTRMRQACGRLEVHAAAVRAAVIEHPDHRREACRVDAVSPGRAYPCDAAHPGSRSSKAAAILFAVRTAPLGEPTAT